MELKDILREKLMAETLGERDGAIIALHQENERLNKELDKRRAAETKEGADK